MRNYTFRLSPEQDLYNSIEMFVRQAKLEAGCLLSGVGSLTQITLRFANQEIHHVQTGYFEIASITGTVSTHGSHLHISVSDEHGKTIGGHLAPGCMVYTTAEIVILAFDDVIYKREFAEDSGYDELVVHNK